MVVSLRYLLDHLRLIVDCIVPENISLTATPFEVTISWDDLVAADSYFLVYKLPWCRLADYNGYG